MWKPEISANLFEEYDWRTYRKEQPVSPKEEPPPYRRTIREGLEKPLDAIYCHAVMLYRELHILLADYPTMQTLMDRYALNITSDNFLEIQKNHDLRNSDPGDPGLMMANGFFDVLHREIIYGNDLVI
ncbi:MAG: hypothetical protein IJ347_05905 [Faecalibacterium sp.]|nr:hypothetical protein [Faecalibacterium sp.]